ncbi:glycosyltransferase [Proteiniphilum sp. X52]|uniref:glycosyltransferase n=1 Tax=Proteiniphilum sp. X52 TaxID=2382159 RepID=UPI000F0A52B6|nr:glycosyltransferase family 2 protein [Proteiniphilum sp. X52]RNC66766.1 glycosyltransferase [Proteiniphilum sp. X52]
MEEKKTVILYVTHRIDETIIERYVNIKNSVKNMSDVFLLFNKEEENVDIPEGIIPYYFDVESLNNLCYEPIKETIIPGSNHFAVLQFFKDYPTYDYYWNIEYDVYFTGEWDYLFSSFDHIDADFLSSHIERFKDFPNWYWWHSFHLNDVDLPLSQMIKSFNPIYRISKGALKLLNNTLKGGRSWGHHEVFIPTVLNYFGMKIIDFGGHGEFVIPGNEEKFYSSQGHNNGSMRYRPAYYENEVTEINKLYHPVKSHESPEILSVIVTYNGENWIKSCLSSLEESSYKTKILVIDNASQDSTIKILKTEYPHITLIENTKNIGFGQANNLGFQYALDNNYDYVLLVNQDVRVEKQMIRELIDCFSYISNYGILSPLHLTGDGLDLDKNFFRYISSGAPIFIKDLILNKIRSRVYSCNFINAAIWLVSIECIRRVGGFDPLFFHTGEDVDYCNRVIYKGLNIGFSPYAKAFHARENRIIPDLRFERYYHKYILSIAHLKNPNLNINYNRYVFYILKEAISSLLRLNLYDFKSNFKIAYKLFSIRKKVLKNRILN